MEIDRLICVSKPDYLDFKGMTERMESPKSKKNIKAVGLLSGGLDSTLAAKMMLEQGIEVHAINFTSPFCTCTPKKAGCAAVVTAVKALGKIPLKQVAMRDEYLEMVRNPKHGYGKGINPCIDCRILKIKKAGDYMRKIGASFLFTGEVLGQRPMSQHKQAIAIIDDDSGLKGHILRPLSANHFEATVPEREGWVKREKLLGISGRSRKTQIALAAEKDIRDYPCPAGGCLLTDKYFSERMRDYLKFTDKPSIRDIPLLKVGRHFRLEGGDKLIVARNEQECKTLQNLYREKDHLLTPIDFPGPILILQGNSIQAAIEKMLHYTKPVYRKNVRINCLHRGKNQILTFDEKADQTSEKISLDINAKPMIEDLRVT
jgi:tRNA U34 2-thiouridine synthase MnmA/TrmU